DSNGAAQTASFLQVVYLPLTANRPTASTNVLTETPASGNPRLWVVNQDNDSVSVFDAVTRAKLGEVAVGSAPRSLARAADGAMVYVSRFITPPLPGEGTAVVAPTTSTGGEVLQVDASAMTAVRTIVLQHSDKPDFETQGRGIPNYLGAATLSPDGTQAWV